MYKRSSAGLSLCEPTTLYNLITRCDRKPSVLDSNYLLILDVRNRKDYEHSHITLAKHIEEVKEADTGNSKYRTPFGADVSTVLHCVVYDGKTVSLIEDNSAIRLATELAENGSKNPVLVLKGGYERFSAEYPFLRTQKILYTPKELEHLPHYPSEILPHFLYLGDERHAYNPLLSYDIKIKGHINVSSDLYSAWPETVNEVHVDVQDVPQANLLERFEEVCSFIESYRKKSETVLVFGNKGMSRSATLVAAYLIYYKNMNHKVALDYIRNCRPNVKPLKSFVDQLKEWEKMQSEPK
ncbi:PREDICTED: serine/threonine/tyrosine-interacting-like protein 1 [Amphimedon queenslandica]|uniref:protein-tyrosine-phosphatase n=1 Tax=Amphimedon queenslandica TaxID=400682 RepID=A0A1X7UQS4_AMPQE|nr:PREDICTED: serine/threonine/tyrosine-interacting-like protein 1 [Amphimedon queenslandica]|eukprot:XP_019853001.1 PREDICTED: serine/threonine/tyrosine-interacting-like protein 1 [Amphimedon queenslandica]